VHCGIPEVRRCSKFTSANLDPTLGLPWHCNNPFIMRPCLLAFPCFVLSAAGQKKCRPRPPHGTGLPLSSFTRPLGFTPSSASTAPTFLPIQFVTQSSEPTQPASPPIGSISSPPLSPNPVQPSTSSKLSKKGLGWATKNPLLASKLAVGTLSWCTFACLCSKAQRSDRLPLGEPARPSNRPSILPYAV
jgi:hypothetical protein